MKFDNSMNFEEVLKAGIAMYVVVFIIAYTLGFFGVGVHPLIIILAAIAVVYLGYVYISSRNKSDPN